MPAKRKKKRSKFRMSLIKTRLMKKEVRKELLPLYNHILNLARDSHERGYTKRAGIELLKARRLAKK
ncbi:MAG: hypothetical protein WBY94_04570 [Polyangiaceae bacterium]